MKAFCAAIFPLLIGRRELVSLGLSTLAVTATTLA